MFSICRQILGWGNGLDALQMLMSEILKSANPKAGSAQTLFILSHDVSSHTRLLLPCGHVTGHADYYIHLEEPTIQRFCIGGYIHEYLGSICGGLGVVIS